MFCHFIAATVNLCLKLLLKLNVVCFTDVDFHKFMSTLLFVIAGRGPAYSGLRPLCRSSAPAQGEKGNW